MDEGRFYLTQQGINLIAFCHTGEKMRFTRAKFGDGEIESLNELMSMTDIKSPKAEFPVTKVEANKNKDGRDNGEATITVDVDNATVDSGFLVREIGIYAEDPRYGEILYAVRSSRTYPNYLAPKDVEFVNSILKVIVIVGNASNLSINIDRSMVCVTHGDFDNLAGNERTFQTVYNNWTLIQQLTINLAMINIKLLTGSDENTAVVDFRTLDGDEDFWGILDVENGRLIG